jgi:hypothetical protein
MKKTCERCKALQWMFGKVAPDCVLEYKQLNRKPVENCPKPVTYAALVFCKNNLAKESKK